MSTGDIKGRWKRFAEKVAEGHSATDAYLAVGYRPSTREVAHRAASRLRAQPEIRAYIQNLRETADQEAREDTTLTIREKLAFLARIVKTSAASLAEDDEIIQSHRILKDGRASTRIPCKLKALKMHSELAGHLPPARPEPSASIDPLQLLFDQIRAGRILPDPTPQPMTSHPKASPKNARFLPTINDHPRPGITEAAHLSRNASGPSPQLPEANASKESSEQVSPTQQTTTKLEPDEGGTSQCELTADPSKIQPSGRSHPPPTPERTPNPTAPPPVCQLKAEPLKTPHPLTPTQLRKLMLDQLRRDSSIHYPQQPALQSPPPPPCVVRS